MTEVVTTSLADLMSQSALPQTTPNGYREQLKSINFMSYSTWLDLHACPRKFLLNKITAKPEGMDNNIDFLFGHAVAAGVQSYITYGNKDRAIMDCFLAWNGDLDLEKPKAKKSFWFAVAAVQKFILVKDTVLGVWEIAIIDEKPAVELSFMINMENGYYYLGHVDVILVDKGRNRFMVLELKTTGNSTINDAMYKNSAQAIGYSIILDTLAARLGIDNNNYTVLYTAYKVKEQEYEPLPYLKTKAERAIWLHDLLTDFAIIDLYRKQNHFPMRGESCYNYFRQCEHFGTCQLKHLTDKLAEVPEAMEGVRIEGVDYYFKLSEIIKTELGVEL